jgi:hypothetical protein
VCILICAFCVFSSRVSLNTLSKVSSIRVRESPANCEPANTELGTTNKQTTNKQRIKNTRKFLNFSISKNSAGHDCSGDGVVF